MSGQDSAMRAKARMQQVRKEMSERRALRDRKAAAIKQQAAESFRSQGAVADQVSKNLAELAKRRQQAGGWGTENTERNKDYVLGFGIEGEETPYAYRPAARPIRDDEQTGGLGSLEDEEESAAETRPAEPPAPPRPAAARPAPERRPAQPVDDEDDFSNQSSWMTNQ